MALSNDGIPVSGSTGAHTYSRNRAGAYTRRRTKPVNPNSPRQQFARAQFGSAINYWTDTLTPLQRAAWNTYAAGVPWLNKIGQPMFLTGQNAFVRFFTWYAFWMNAAPASLDPPSSFDLGIIAPDIATPCVATYDTSANTIAVALNAPLFNNPWQVDGAKVSCSASQPSNASRAFRPNRFASVIIAEVPEAPTGTISFAATASPWVYQSGQIGWFKFAALDPDNALSVTQLVGPVLVTVQA